MQPVTRYAKSGDVHVAYQVFGDGPFDLLHIPGFVSNVELAWEEPSYEHFLRRLGSFARLIVFDKRGTGMSDRLPTDRLPTLEERMDDIRAVLDEVDEPEVESEGASCIRQRVDEADAGEGRRRIADGFGDLGACAKNEARKANRGELKRTSHE